MPTRYSYRADPAVPQFDDSQPLIVFDGMCVLCSRGVEWMMRHDRQGTSHLAAIQEPLPRSLYAHYKLDADRFDTFMVLAGGWPYVRWQGMCAAARTMPQPWRGFGYLGRAVPAGLGDLFYDWVQRNRVRWFGARDKCFVPDEVQRTRFLSLQERPPN